MDNSKPFVLSIAGFDPSAGAGVLADIKTMEQCGVYGLAVNTATTFQNEDEFDGLEWVSFEGIKKQLEPLLRKYEVKSVKIGLIRDLETLSKTISLLHTQFPVVPIIWDPILSASAGFDFHTDLDKKLLNDVLAQVTLITPNKPEYDILGKVEAVNVLLKGGHADVKNDILIRGIRETIIEGSTEVMKPKHGSGCVLSSAIAAYLALGKELDEACLSGKRYVEGILKSNDGLLGYHNM